MLRHRAAVILLVIALAAGMPSAFASSCHRDPHLEAKPTVAGRGLVHALARNRIWVEEICQGPKGPRIYARFTADPQSGPNGAFYNRVYLRVMDRLAVRHAELVDREDSLLISLDRRTGTTLDVAYAPWAAP